VDPVFHWTLRLGLALVLGTSGLFKLRNLEGFRRSLANYRLLPPSLEGTAALLVPVLELGVAILILSPVYPLGIALFLLLIALFSGAILWGLRQGGGFSCGCLGDVEEPLSPWLLLRNALLALLGALAYLGSEPRSLGFLDALSVLMGGLFFLLAYLTASLFLANRGRMEEVRR
jgi:uncharacterized membrane protein YphA (DoxX/SURF4 family)